MMIDKAYCIVFLSPLAGRMEIFMINVSGHLRNERRATGFEDLSTALTVNCCGMQIFKTKDYKQNRAAGRVDYQLIYIYKGAGHYSFMESGNLSVPEMSFCFAQRKHKPILIFLRSILKSIGFTLLVTIVKK